MTVAPPPSSVRSAPRHIEALTGLRGFAALFVVVYHLSGGFLPNLSIEGTKFLAKGYLAVDLFFLLSGFVMMHVYGRTFQDRLDRADFSAFVLARFARLYPLHLAILLGLILLEVAKVALLAIDPSVPDVEPFVGGRTLATFLMHATMTHGFGLFPGPSWNGPAWSIGAEWVAYLVFPIVVFALARSGPLLRLGLFLAAAVGLVLVASGPTALDVTYAGGLWRCLAEFALGAMLYAAHAGGRLRALRHDAVAFGSLTAILLTLHAGVADILVVPPMAILILSLAQSDGRFAGLCATKPALFLGTVSYSVYMSHILMIEIANLASRGLTHQPLGVHLGQAQSLAVLATGPLLVVAVSWLLHLRVELPGRAAIKAWRPSAGDAATERA